MKLSVMLFPFHKALADKTLSPQKLVRDLHQAGITGLEPAFNWVTTEAARWAELREAAEQSGMRFPCLDIIVNLVGESDGDRRRALDCVARGVECCFGLKCPVALLAGSRPSPGMSNADGRKRYAETLAKAADRARGAGVTLTIEDFGIYPDFACSADHVLEVLELASHPDLKLTFDNGNFLLADKAPSACFERLKHRVVHVHIKDFDRSPPGEPRGIRSRGGILYSGCEIGEGKAEVDQCLRRLTSGGYNGWLSLEVGVSPPLASAVQGANHVSRIREGA